MAKDQEKFDRLIYCINMSQNGLIPYEHHARPIALIREATTPEELDAYPLCHEINIESYHFYLSYRGLTDDDVEKLLARLSSKPLLACKIRQFAFDHNNLTKIPVISKSDFPNLNKCSIGNNPITLKYELIPLILHLRIGIPLMSYEYNNLGPSSSARLNINILDKYFINMLNEALMEAYRNLITLMSRHVHSKIIGDIYLVLKINSFITPSENILKSDINNLEQSLEKNNEGELLALVRAYKQEILPRFFAMYHKKFLNAHKSPQVEGLFNLNSFLNKNGFKADNLNMKNSSNYTPRYLALKNLLL